MTKIKIKQHFRVYVCVILLFLTVHVSNDFTLLNIQDSKRIVTQ